MKITMLLTILALAGFSAVPITPALAQTAPQISQAPQGDWQGTYGSAGYALAAWEGTSDLAYFPQATLVVEQANRHRWTAASSEVRALQDPGKSTRRAATFYHSSSVKLRLDFSEAYSGNLHLYALDWDGTARRQSVTVDDGSGPRTAYLATSFNQGAWIKVPVTVAASGSVRITATRTAGANAVLAGVFLGEGPATTFFVATDGNDENAGTSPSIPWKSLQKVSDAVLAPGDKVLFKRGHTWTGTLSLKRSGTSAARIVIGSYGSGALPIIEAGQSCVYVFASYVTLTELHAHSCVWGGIDIHGSDNRVENSVMTKNAAGVVVNPGGNRNVIVNNELRDNDRMSTLTETPTNDDSGAFGVVVGSDDNEIAYNKISGSYAMSYDYGQDGAALEVYGGQRNFFHHNVTYENDTFAELGDARAADNTFAYNTVVSTFTKSFFLVTRGPNDTFGPVLRTSLYNNSVYLPGSESQGVVCYAGCSTDILTMRNNIVRAVGKVGYADGPFLQTNNLFSGGKFQGELSGLSEPIVMVVDPGYLDPGAGDLHLKPLSEGIDKGVDVGYKEDVDRLPIPFDGNLDGVAVPDIGAFEFRP